ncbi:RNA-binding domain-containing protein [Carboxylicivirga taeanensis]|uniref:RNA-binding domain-containing protein n=1 Tax=Carboxylicivirga taeanensis TaxID=1416875 RepID=UPI003F6DB467
METRLPGKDEYKKLLDLKEDHFNDLKSKDIKPSKLQETFVAFANADGGEIWIGVEDEKKTKDRLKGFQTKEEANDILHTVLELTEPAVENVDVEFIDFNDKGFVLHLNIPKSSKVHYCSNGDCFLRINARKDKIKGDRITQLGYAKGALVYEKQPIDILDVDEFEYNEILFDYMVRVKSNLDVPIFLKKQRLLSFREKELKPNVACALLFEEEPQATLDTRCAIKVYRLLTSDDTYKREQLKEAPKTINGPIENQIHEAIKLVNELLKDTSITVNGELEKFIYPSKAIHEILVNAVIHRDYSLNDDIHIRIFDNRIEVISPGKLPGYITLNNIYNERFSRNPNIVRLLHNLPDPVNHDIGEGLDTVKNEMKKAGLIDPIIEELDNSVKITIKHKRLASLEDIILNYLSEDSSNSTITNRMVRDLSGEDDVNKIKKAFQKLRKLGKIEPVDENASAFNFSYKIIDKA